jgi:hypothetical protein
MKRFSHILFWTFALFLVAACRADDANPTSIACTFAISINDVTSLFPGESTYLSVSETSGFGWNFDWTASSGLLSDPVGSTIRFDAPTNEGPVQVSVTVTNGQGCTAAESIEIDVVGQETSTPTTISIESVTVEPTVTATPSSTPTASHTPTSISSATSTQEPTATFTNAPVHTPMPSHTPTPSAVAFQMFLEEPKHETCVGTENAVFKWLATRPLNSIEGKNGEYYALNIWAEGSLKYSVSWIKEPRYEIGNVSDPIVAYTEEINCSGADGCYWNVDLIVSHVDRGSGWFPDSFTKLFSSPVRKFCTVAAPPSPLPVPPTDTPQPQGPGGSGLPTRTG